VERLFNDRNGDRARQAGWGRRVPVAYLYVRTGVVL
jgi:hypothetical protein